MFALVAMSPLHPQSYPMSLGHINASGSDLEMLFDVIGSINSLVESTGSEPVTVIRAPAARAKRQATRPRRLQGPSLPAEKFFSKAKLHSEKEPALCPM